MADAQTNPASQTATQSPAPVVPPAAVPLVLPPKPTPPAAPRHIRPKIGKNVIGCAVSIIIVVLVVLSILALLVAKTGLVKVPLFSRFYSGPLPTRLVSAEPMTGNAFKVLLSSRLLSQSLAKKRPPYVIKLNEREVSGALETAIDSALRDEKWKQVFTQLVIRPTDLEMLSQYEYKWIQLDVLIRFLPKVENGGVSFVPVYAQVGDYRISPNVAYTVLGYLFSRDLGTWSVKFGDMALSAVRLYDTYLEVVVSSPAPTAQPAS